jgi:hypothetical protein
MVPVDHRQQLADQREPAVSLGRQPVTPAWFYTRTPTNRTGAGEDRNPYPYQAVGIDPVKAAPTPQVGEDRNFFNVLEVGVSEAVAAPTLGVGEDRNS